MVFMTNVQATKLVDYSWSDLFNLVLDVKSYRASLPRGEAVVAQDGWAADTT
jgi:ribosome-associated toxin RatA of RatAB toxin-antitoxin module